MRTTVTLEPDVVALVRRVMREQQLTFKEAINVAVRVGLGRGDDDPAPFETPTFAMGEPTVPLDGALRLAADLEDEEPVYRS